MDKSLRRLTTEYTQAAYRKERWRKIVTALAAVVVFCTTYALILPAITMEQDIFCGLEEHTEHSAEAGCYAQELVLCCTEDHEHTDECYELQDMLICEKPLHTHTMQCYSDPEADVESSDVWERTADGIDCDVIAMAKTQLGYAESERNYRVAEDGTLHGYTRYGDWYGDPYANWNALFCSFCLHYAGVGDGASCDADCAQWAERLNEADALGSADSIPQTGDLVFFDTDADGEADRMGFVAKLLCDVDDAPEKIKTIEGDLDGIVGYAEYDVTDACITGYSTVSQAEEPILLAALAAPSPTYTVWFDGTDGGLMSLGGAGNTSKSVSNGKVTLPKDGEITPPQKYDYTLTGWYDIVDKKFYKPGDEVTITKNTVFYAGWDAASYDVGQNNEHVVGKLNTADFITTHVFDYNTLFDMQAEKTTPTISGTSHSETWSLVESGTNLSVDGEAKKSLGFFFLDWDSGHNISYQKSDNIGNINNNKDSATTGIINKVNSATGDDLIDILFNPERDVIGKNYVGTGNYLYQYMENGLGNYDGKHDGYYYYDSKLNAASYNQSDGRFYVYDYLERTSDSEKDKGGGEYSDFLPFNSPYANTNGQEVHTYSYGGTTNYQYDAKYSGQYSYEQYIGTNYWFGMNSSIHFYLPNNSGSATANLSTTGDQMEFEFSGDDDVWVFVDGVLTLDIGGVHGIKDGKINFSTGVVTKPDGTTEKKSFSAGDHTLDIYYLERGGSQSNCAIYFNIVPRYTLELAKQDARDNTYLPNAAFEVFTDPECTQYAELWASEEAYRTDSTNKITRLTTGADGKCSCWGLTAGNTYYIKEVTAPEGYPDITDDVVALYLNNSGNRFLEVLPGADGVLSGHISAEGSTDENVQNVLLWVNNALPETAQVAVFKLWGDENEDGTVHEDDSVTVRLTADGVDVDGESVILNRRNGWSYMWIGLPHTDESGRIISYSVREDNVDGYLSIVQDVGAENALFNGIQSFCVINTLSNERQKTWVDVSKVWDDGGADHSGDEITLRLYADGHATDRTLKLSSANDWAGKFDDLPCYGADGETKITYAVREDRVPFYEAAYDVQTVSHSTTGDGWVAANGLAKDKIFRFVSGDYALACTDKGALTSTDPGADSEYSQWKAVSNSGGYKLQNVGSKTYLKGGNPFTVDGSGSVFYLDGQKLYYQYSDKGQTKTGYVQIKADGTFARVNDSKNATAFAVTTKGTVTTSLPDSYTITVTNTPAAEYELPETGGRGVLPLFTFGVLLTAGAPLCWLWRRRKRCLPPDLSSLLLFIKFSHIERNLHHENCEKAFFPRADSRAAPFPEHLRAGGHDACNFRGFN